ncbi:MAG: tRNA uridine(34) 5-carboxymethylaminomethyl modification radical SAM/GNAT enzyme Elp3 [Thermoplasmata archaeon]|nr:MAG: tRNA uridine(34) 5-carboxymethylaminomethyl modification radical SAM/GNAT enzyme Elp3 [Thermoplasmata archaeon]
MSTAPDNTDIEAQINLYSDIYNKIISGEIRSRDELHKAKVKLCKVHMLKKIPRNSDILENAPEDIYDLVLPLLKLKPMRTMSGVAPVAVMTSPDNCPHGRCSYCPGGVKNGTAQSYTGHEPAALRATAHSFGPYHQTTDRLKQLETIGHPTDKIDLIIMGGTFTTRSEEYQYWFIKRCFDALNQANSKSLIEAQLQNELAQHRCIGMTLETRPDACTVPHVKRILNLGATRVELGVQTLEDAVLVKVKRGHGSAETRAATHLLKNAGMKVCYHIMPNLPGMTPARDLELFQQVFDHAEYRPDMIKIYPTLVVKGTELFEQWVRKEYESYMLDETIELIAKLKAMAPPWIRIQRVQRDIPAKLIEAGVKYSNLRQMVQERLHELGERCRCIRCREVGQNLENDKELDENNFKLHKVDYDASGGREAFISIDDKKYDFLIAFVRLRMPDENVLEDVGQPKVPEGIKDFAFVRELKVFGQLVPISSNPLKIKPAQPLKDGGGPGSKEWQHKGYGRALMEAAEKFAVEEWDINNILVNSGIGAREYYKKLDYIPHGHYMAKFNID